MYTLNMTVSVSELTFWSEYSSRVVSNDILIEKGTIFNAHFSISMYQKIKLNSGYQYLFYL